MPVEVDEPLASPPPPPWPAVLPPPPPHAASNNVAAAPTAATDAARVLLIDSLTSLYWASRSDRPYPALNTPSMSTEGRPSDEGTVETGSPARHLKTTIVTKG